MAVTLRLTSDGRVEVDAYLISERHGVRGSVAFVVDTGSQKTILGARDAETLGFPAQTFPAYTGPTMFGVGGKGRPLEVGRCQIVLGGGEFVGEVDMIYFAPERETKVKARAPGVRQTRQKVFALPSLLGTDFLSERHCRLVIDWRSRTGEIRGP